MLDGNSVLHRAYYALPDWRNRSGEATAGVYGFLSMMVKATEELKPTHLVVVFDNPEPTFRHTMYVGYQVTREKDRQVSEDIWGQVEKLTGVLGKMGVPVLSQAGFEADDIIGTLCQFVKGKGEGKGKEGVEEVVVITGDKDLMQLVDGKVKLYMPQKGLSDGMIIDGERVKEKLGVGPEQVVDYKALVGDSSDNYPGVAGIGPKTAVKLLGEYETFEGVVEQAMNPKSQIPENVRKKIVEGYEGGELSKRLATIKRDVPVSLQLGEAVVPSGEEMAGVFKGLGYKSLVKRMTGEEMEVDRAQESLFERVS